MKRGVLIIFLVFSLLIISNVDSATVAYCQGKGLGICSTALNYNCQDDAVLIQAISGYSNYCSNLGCPAQICSDSRTAAEVCGTQCGGTKNDNCGVARACVASNCVSPNTCGGGGTANVCGCTPATCSGKICGSYSDGCGGTLNCGTCSSGVCNPSGQCVLVEDNQPCGANSQCRSGNCGGPNMLCTPSGYQCYFNVPNLPEPIGGPYGYQDICTSDNSPWYTSCDSSTYCTTAPTSNYLCRKDTDGVGKWLSACPGGTLCDSATGACKSQCVANSGQACGCSGTYDCNGNCINDSPPTTYYRDSDSDSYGDPSISQTACSQPAGYVTNAQDCNDNNININPGKLENTQALCSDTLDNNCNGKTDCADQNCVSSTRPVPTGGCCAGDNTVCSSNDACRGNVCTDLTSEVSSTCCYKYDVCIAKVSENQQRQARGETNLWPISSTECQPNTLTEDPACY